MLFYSRSHLICISAALSNVKICVLSPAAATASYIKTFDFSVFSHWFLPGNDDLKSIMKRARCNRLSQHSLSLSRVAFPSGSSKTADCVSFQIFSPVIHIHVEHRLSPLQLLSSQGMTQFLFIIIMHSLPAWIDYTHATSCPQFNFLPGGM